MAVVYKNCPVCMSVLISPVLTAKDHTVTGEEFEIWKCSDCTLRFTQTIPDANDIGKYYKSEDYISHSDSKKGLINSLYHKVRKRTLRSKKKLIETATGKSTGAILDLGAGTGAFLNMMKEASWNITGIEPDEVARQNALENHGLNLQDPAAMDSLPGQSFDAITMWHVLEHVHDVHGYLKRLKELLKPGGRIFIAVPNYTCHDAGVYKEYWAAYDVPRHLYHFSPASMKYLLRSHELNLESVKPMWYDSFYVCMLSDKYKNGKGNVVVAFWNGFVSNIKALFEKSKCSSIIYIISK